MHFKSTLLAISTLSALAAANPLVARGDGDGGDNGGSVSQCNTGTASCCNSVQSADSSPVSDLLGLLGVVLGDITGLIGLGCTPLSVIGLGQGANCAQQPVCCTGNEFNGLINIGCTPISL